MDLPVFEVRLTEGAEDDLEGIVDYVAEHRSPDEANALLTALLEKAATLKTFPKRGNVPKELLAVGATEWRQISLPPYRLIYEIRDNTVLVSLIVDGRRDLPALLEYRLLER